jgi:hypothetical protein
MKRRLIVASASTLAGLLAGWTVFVRLQGDSDVIVAGGELSEVAFDGEHVRGVVELYNRGRQPAVVRRVTGWVVEGPSGTVTVTRAGMSGKCPYWVANLLAPATGCAARIEIQCERLPDTPILVGLDVEEIGRSLAVHRHATVTIPPPSQTPTTPAISAQRRRS